MHDPAASPCGGTAFIARVPMIASCGEHAARLLARFGAEPLELAAAGTRIEAGRPVLVIRGNPPRASLKAALRLLGHACGIATAAAALVDAARRIRPDIELACLRGPHLPVPSVARPSLLAGGMAVDPGPLAFALDVRDFAIAGDPAGILRFRALRAAAGSPAVIEAQSPADVDETVLCLADALVLDGFSPRAVRDVRDKAFGRIPVLDIVVKGDVNAGNVADYAASGARMLITAAPLSAPRADIALALSATPGEAPSSIATQTAQG
jgi:Nicotinate-nucleotide pyrophosphorylase